MQKPRVGKTGSAWPQWQEGVRFVMLDAVIPRRHKEATEEGRSRFPARKGFNLEGQGYL